MDILDLTADLEAEDIEAAWDEQFINEEALDGVSEDPWGHEAEEVPCGFDDPEPADEWWKATGRCTPGCSVLATAAATPEEPPPEEEQRGLRQEIQQARQDAQTKLHLMSSATADDAALDIKLLALFEGGAVHDRIKIRTVATGAAGSYAKRIPFQSTWLQPIAWVLEQFGWSRRLKTDDGPSKKRQRSVTFLELTCAIELLTGHAVGPADAPYRVKIAVVKKGVEELLKQTPMWKRSQNSSMELIQKGESAAMFGFPTLPGLHRRPTFSQFDKLNEAVATLMVLINGVADVAVIAVVTGVVVAVLVSATTILVAVATVLAIVVMEAMVDVAVLVLMVIVTVAVIVASDVVVATPMIMADMAVAMAVVMVVVVVSKIMVFVAV